MGHPVYIYSSFIDRWMNTCAASGEYCSQGKTCHSATLSIANRTWTGLGSSPGFCLETLAANNTIHGTVLDLGLIILNPVDTLTQQFQFCYVQCFLRAQYKKKEWREWWILERQINKKNASDTLLYNKHILCDEIKLPPPHVSYEATCKSFRLYPPEATHLAHHLQSTSNRNKILKNYYRKGKWSLCKFWLKPQHVSWHILNHCRMWLWLTVPFLSLVCFLFEARVVNPPGSHIRHFSIL